MDSVLSSQIERPIPGNMESLRLKRQRLLLGGCLPDGTTPDNIVDALSRLTLCIAREEARQSQLEALYQYLHPPKGKEPPPLDIDDLIPQGQSMRKEHIQC